MIRQLFLTAIATLCLSADVLASGSIGGGAPRAENRAYSEGKQLYKKRIACKSCVLPGGVSTPDQAKALLEKLGGEYAGLDAAQRDSVGTYLQRRFKL
jgi:hypothetical protein